MSSQISSLKSDLRLLAAEQRKQELLLEEEIERLLCSGELRLRDSTRPTVCRQLPDVQLLRDDLQQLSTRISFTASLAGSVSSKIRHIDSARSRVADCLQRVDDVLELKYATSHVQLSLQAQDYEKAAAHIHRFLAIDFSAIRSSQLTTSGNHSN